MSSTRNHLSGSLTPEAHKIVRGVVDDLSKDDYIVPATLLQIVQRAALLAVSAISALPPGLMGEEESVELAALHTSMYILTGAKIEKLNKVLSDQRRKDIHRRLVNILSLCRKGEKRRVQVELGELRKRLGP